MHGCQLLRVRPSLQAALFFDRAAARFILANEACIPTCAGSLPASIIAAQRSVILNVVAHPALLAE